MKFSPGFDPNKGCLTFNLECQLLGKYYELFETIVKTSGSSGIEVERESKYCAKISLQLSSEEKSLTGETGADSMRVAVNADRAKLLNELVNKFINQSLRKELKCVEFIPIEGYSWDDMRNDIKQAIKKHRNFCIIKDYDEYLTMESKRTYVFHQKMVIYGTEEYADVAIMIHRDEQEKVKEIYAPQLQLVDWC